MTEMSSRFVVSKRMASCMPPIAKSDEPDETRTLKFPPATRLVVLGVRARYTSAQSAVPLPFVSESGTPQPQMPADCLFASAGQPSVLFVTPPHGIGEPAPKPSLSVSA